MRDYERSIPFNGLNKVFMVFVKERVVEGWGRVEDGVMLRDIVLRSGGQ